jgi:uncharacterized protein YqgV (UPF0045/DUF77 family)
MRAEGTQVIVEIQVLPSPPGTPESRWAHVEAAISLIRASGLRFEVGPLGTSIEGEPDELWPLLRRVHEATLAAGADGVVSVIKVEQAATAELQPSIDDLVAKHRPRPAPLLPASATACASSARRCCSR